MLPWAPVKRGRLIYWDDDRLTGHGRHDPTGGIELDRSCDAREHLRTFNRRDAGDRVRVERDALQREIRRCHEERAIQFRVVKCDRWNRFRPRLRIDDRQPIGVVQRTRRPGGVDSPPIIESERDVRRLLNLVDRDAGAKRVERPSRDEHRRPPLGGDPAQAFGGRTIGTKTRSRELLLASGLVQPEIDDAPRNSRQDVIGLRLSGAETGRGGRAIVRMDLNRQVGLPIDQFDEQRKERRPPVASSPLAPIQESGSSRASSPKGVPRRWPDTTVASGAVRRASPIVSSGGRAIPHASSRRPPQGFGSRRGWTLTGRAVPAVNRTIPAASGRSIALPPHRLQLLDDPPNLLRIAAVDHQQGIFGVDDRDVFEPDERHESPGFRPDDAVAGL